MVTNFSVCNDRIFRREDALVDWEHRRRVLDVEMIVPKNIFSAVGAA
jgi:hypothetical protein